MNSLNSVLLEGNVEEGPVLSTTPKGTPVCTFRLATARFYRHDENTVKEVSYFSVEAWSKLAEYCEKNLEKAKAIRVVGHLKEDRWKAADGSPRSKIKVVAEHIEIIK